MSITFQFVYKIRDLKQLHHLQTQVNNLQELRLVLFLECQCSPNWETPVWEEI